MFARCEISVRQRGINHLQLRHRIRDHCLAHKSRCSKTIKYYSNRTHTIITLISNYSCVRDNSSAAVSLGGEIADDKYLPIQHEADTAE